MPWRDFQQATRFAVMFGIAAGCFYLTFVVDRSHENVPVLWIATVIAESIVVLHTLGIWSTLVSYRNDIPDNEEVAVVRRALLTGALATPTTDVFICHATEPLHLVLKTAIAAREMQLPHNTWVLDDGKDPILREACLRLGIGYIKRETNAHAKAGNVNSAVQRTNGRFIVVLDADHVPRPDMLVQTLPILIANPSVALVQTPQTYDFAGRGMVAEGAAVSQELFYEAIMPAKNQSNSAFCVGTNVIYRRDALASLVTRVPTWQERVRARRRNEVATSQSTAVGREYPRGGIWVGSNSEDIWTSLELHKRGWRTVFVPKVLTQGLTPDTITAFLKQQFRWASGGWEILLWGKVLRDAQLTLSQKIQYMMVPSHYALSFATAIFSLLSPIYLLADKSPIRAGFVDWAVHYVPFYVLMVAVPFVQAGKFRPSAIIVSLAASPAHVRAFFATLTRQKAAWSVTNGSHGGFRLRTIKPHLAIGALGIAAVTLRPFLGGRNLTSTLIAMYFVGLQLALLVAMLVGSRRADRLAAAAEAEEPTAEEALAMLDEWLSREVTLRG